jgi:hypothetical protein
MSLCFYAEDTEAIFVVVESDALDDAGDFLGRGPAFRDCGIHVWGFIFPWSALRDRIRRPDFEGIGCREGSGRRGRLTGAGCLLGQTGGYPWSGHTRCTRLGND